MLCADIEKQLIPSALEGCDFDLDQHLRPDKITDDHCRGWADITEGCAQYGKDRISKACLLYTSPSPRD